MKFERRPVRWRMFDPWCITLERKRPGHVPLTALLRTRQIRARMAAARRGPNKHGRHFHPLTTDVLDARREGVDPRALRGAGQ